MEKYIIPRYQVWSVVLQYGHELSAVETTQKISDSLESQELQFGHDLSAVETGMLRQEGAPGCTGFNSATTFQPWKLIYNMAEYVEVDTLQFGHDLSAVESLEISPPSSSVV